MGVYRNSWGEKRTDGDRSPKILEFLKALDELQERFDLSLSHEDGHGSFEVSHGYGESWVDEASEVIKS